MRRTLLFISIRLPLIPKTPALLNFLAKAFLYSTRSSYTFNAETEKRIKTLCKTNKQMLSAQSIPDLITCKTNKQMLSAQSIPDLIDMN